MSSEDTVWNTLKGNNPYSVSCRHNFFTGSRYEASVRSLKVLAASEEDAKQFIIANLDLAEEHFRGRRMPRGASTVRLIRKCEGYKLTARDVIRATPIKGTMSIKAFNRQGEYVRYNS